MEILKDELEPIKEFLNFNQENLKQYCQKVEEIRSKTRGRIPHNHINIIPVLIDYLGSNFKNYLEIGTYWGGSMILAMNSEQNGNFFGIDFFGLGPNNEFLDADSNQGKLEVMSGHAFDYQSIYNQIFTNSNGKNFNLIQGNSQDSKIIDKVYSIIPSGVEILFIDGNHSLNGVVTDFNNYKNIVNPGGFIIFDDYGWITDVKMAVDSFDLTDFNIIGRPQLVEMNEWKSELDNQLNASFIIQKNK